MNLRQLLPVLNAKIKSLIKSKNLGVLILGPFSNFNYYAKHLTVSQFGALSVIEGLHWSSNLFTQGLVITSEGFNICGHQNLFSISANTASKALNLTPLRVPIFQTPSLLFNWNGNIVTNITKDKPTACEVYIGTHGDSTTMSADIILPSTSVIEKEGLFLNSFGVVQQASKVLFKAGNSRDEISILKAFVVYFKLQLEITDINILSSMMISSLSQNNLNFKFSRFRTIFPNKKIEFDLLDNFLPKMLKFSKILATSALVFKEKYKSNFNYDGIKQKW